MLDAQAAVVETTKAGVVNGALSHLADVPTKAAFACACVHGFGSNLLPEKRAELATAVYGWAHESPADHRRVLDSYWSAEKGARPSLSMFQDPHVFMIHVSSSTLHHPRFMYSLSMFQVGSCPSRPTTVTDRSASTSSPRSKVIISANSLGPHD